MPNAKKECFIYNHYHPGTISHFAGAKGILKKNKADRKRIETVIYCINGEKTRLRGQVSNVFDGLKNNLQNLPVTENLC